MINLISDTITKPTPEMLAAMMAAEVGDDVFGQDPTVNALEAKAAALFNKEAALFCPSGTMTNQIAIKTHTQPLDEVICDPDSHIYQYETGGYAYHSGVAINLVKGTNGKLSADLIRPAIKADYDWLPRTRLVVLENTCNKGGGTIYTLDEIRPIRTLCKDHQLALHLDGARLFNALVETEEQPADVGAAFDSISICLSKGLGAPVGSLLLGDQPFIKQARRLRKVMGGGMRQAGYLAAAGLYALNNHVERLREDNDRARAIGRILEGCSYIAGVRPVQSNILMFDVAAPHTAQSILEALTSEGIIGHAFGPQTIRFVTHLGITDDMITEIEKKLRKLV